MAPEELTHLDRHGHVHMVDVTGKPVTRRRARASCRVLMARSTVLGLASRNVGGGDVLEMARIVGIQAAKRTSQLIPLCHPLLLGDVQVRFSVGADHVGVEAEVESVDRTGVEMEALMAAAVAALSVYEACKSLDRSMSVEELCVWEKSGGRSGTWQRTDDGGVVNLRP